MKLRLKVLLYIILTTSIIFIASVGFINIRYWNYTKKLSIKVADMYTHQSATVANSILSINNELVEVIAQIFSSYKEFDSNIRNEFYDQILTDVLENNPQLSAIWVSWELAAIDKNWTFPYGRKRITAFVNLGNVDMKVDSADLDGDVPGSYYYLLKAGVEKNLLTNPYFYSYTQDTGSSFLEASVAKGIYDGQKFVGAIGIDISLQEFQKILLQLKPFENSRIIIISNDGTVVAYEDEDIIGKKIDKVFPEYNKYYLADKIKKSTNFSIIDERDDGSTDYLSFYPVQINGSNMPWTLGFIVSDDVITKDIKSTSSLLLIISAISLLVIAFIIWSVLSIIVKPIEKTSNTLEALSKGNISDEFKIAFSTKDEMGKMAEAANILIDSLKQMQQFAIQIGKGNLEVEYQLLSKNDNLGKSLIEMRDNLLSANMDEQLRVEESRKMSWTQSGITEVNEILREKSDSVENLSAELIKFLVKYTDSVQGGFYLIKDDDDKKVIALNAAYAFDRKKEVEAEIEIGEGLVGRAVKEKQNIVIEDLPEGYLLVRSGLGDKSPSNLIVVPLLFEGTVLGAFELAGFNKYDESKIEFLEQISVRITSSVSVLLKNIETENLLKESQLQTATFEMKEKQFMRQRRKLSEKQKQLELKFAQLETSLVALKQMGLYLELDEQKNIIYTNDYLLKLFAIEKDEIIGKNISDFVQYIKGSKIWLEKFWEDVFKGETRKKSSVYVYKDVSVQITDVYFLVKEADSNKVIIVGIA